MAVWSVKDSSVLMDDSVVSSGGGLKAVWVPGLVLEGSVAESAGVVRKMTQPAAASRAVSTETAASGFL